MNAKIKKRASMAAHEFLRSSLNAKITKRPSMAAHEFLRSSLNAKITKRPSMAALFTRAHLRRVSRIAV